MKDSSTARTTIECIKVLVWENMDDTKKSLESCGKGIILWKVVVKTWWEL